MNPNIFYFTLILFYKRQFKKKEFAVIMRSTGILFNVK